MVRLALAAELYATGPHGCLLCAWVRLVCVWGGLAPAADLDTPDPRC